MSSATGTRAAEIVPKRRSRIAELLIRLAREKPLGSACGIIMLILILVSIFADVLALSATRKHTWQTFCRARQPSICWAPTTWGETS